MRSVQKRLWRIYWYLEKLFVPGLRSSQYAYYETLRSHLRRPMKWLDLGCGHQVFPKWMHREQDEVIAKASLAVGLDCDLPSLKNLFVSGPKITNAGMEHLGKMTSLEHLSVTLCRGVSNSGLLYLRGLYRLKRLDLRGTSVLEDGANQLQRFLPNCAMLRD